MLLLFRSKVDFTIFFRELSEAASQQDSNDALMVLEPAFYEACFSQKVIIKFHKMYSKKLYNVFELLRFIFRRRYDFHIYILILKLIMTNFCSVKLKIYWFLLNHVN